MKVIKYFKDYIESINEGYLKTYPINLIINNLINELIDLNLNYNVINDNNKIKLTLNYFNAIPVQNLKDLFELILLIVVNRGGWFPSIMEIENIHVMKNKSKYNEDNLILNHSNYLNVDIIFESKFDDEIVNIPDKLYHLSIGEYSKKILKYGLIPKSVNKLS